MGEQLSFLTAGYAGPEVDDLTGVLAGGGRLVTRGTTLRLSVLVADRWRSDALLAAFAERDLAGEATADEEGDGSGDGEQLWSVRTEFTDRLAGIGSGWLIGASQRPPAGLTFTGAAVRLWAITSGAPNPLGQLLAVGDTDEIGLGRLQAALAAVGLPSALVGPRAGGPALRVTSTRALRHLREYVGAAPAGAEGWPTGWSTHPTGGSAPG